jgi:hypothetical protein
MLLSETEYWSVADFQPAGCLGPATAPLEDVVAITGEGQSPNDDLPSQEESEHEEDLPWVPIVILAFLIPAAVLLIPSFLGKKGPGGH